MKCKVCGAEVLENVNHCGQCGALLTEEKTEATDSIQTQEISSNTIQNNQPDQTSTSLPNNNPKPKSGPAVIIALILLAVIAAANIYSSFINTKNYEYTVKTYFADEAHTRTGSDFSETAAFSTITISEEELNTMGAQGWEVATSYLETETAWPNFGNNEYVSGLQPNIRPQRLVVVFKRPIK